jgi:hypothetical protein
MSVSTLRSVADEIWHGIILSMVGIPLWAQVNGSKPRALIPQGFWGVGTRHRLSHMSLSPRLLLWTCLPTPGDELFQVIRELTAASDRSQRLPRIPIRYL